MATAIMRQPLRSTTRRTLPDGRLVEIAVTELTPAILIARARAAIEAI